MKVRIIKILLVLFLFLGVCISENIVAKEEPHYPNRIEKGASSIYMLAGEFRVVFANLLWIKADQYLHEYIMHNKDWTKNRELLGLIKLITTLDPQFDEPYACGVCIHLYGFNERKEALEYLRQGISNCPKSRKLHEFAAVIYARNFHKYELALEHQKKAVQYAEDDWYRTHGMRRLKTYERLVKEHKKNDGSIK